MLIDSVPPAMIWSAMPAMIRSAAMAMVCEPEEQKRLTVTAGTLSGNPARSDAMRATFVPDSPSGVAHPRITSSTASGASCGVCAINARITSAAMSSGRVVRSDPRGALPTAVRRAETMTASFMCVLLVSQRLPGAEHVLNALDRFRLRGQLHEDFALEVQQILLVHPLRARERAAAQDVCELAADVGVVFAGVAALLQVVDRGAQRGAGIAAGGVAVAVAHRRRVAVGV